MLSRVARSLWAKLIPFPRPTIAHYPSKFWEKSAVFLEILPEKILKMLSSYNIRGAIFDF